MLIVFLRAIILYALIIFSIRLMGKRQIGELQPSELAITILISNMAILPIEDNNIPMIMGAVPIIALVGFEILMSHISLKSLRIRRFISGNPVVVIREGNLIQKNMKSLRFSIDDLMEALRENGIFDISEVYYAVVETTGKVTVLLKSEYQPVTAKTMNISVSDSPPPIVLISNGTLIKDAMNIYQISEKWLDNTLKKNKTSLKDVFLMTVTKDKEYFIIKADEKK